MKVNKIAGKKSTSPLAVQKRLQVRSTASTSGYLNFLLFHKILKKVKNKNILLFLTLLYDRALKLQITARYLRNCFNPDLGRYIFDYQPATECSKISHIILKK